MPPCHVHGEKRRYQYNDGKIKGYRKLDNQSEHILSLMRHLIYEKRIKIPINYSKEKYTRIIVPKVMNGNNYKLYEYY